MYDEDREQENNSSKRAYIHVYFECCNIYQRIYKRRNREAYIGWCPGCGRRVYVRISSSGTDCRFFRAL